MSSRTSRAATSGRPTLKAMKQRALGLAKRGGMYSAVAGSEWRRQRLVILCYHGISLADEHEWNPELYMSPGMFRERLEILRRGRYAVLPLADALQRLYDGTLPPRAVAITFDDGNYDFLAAALPLLREFDMPSTLYLSTFYCRFQRPVFNPVLSYILWKGRARQLDAENLLDGGGSHDLSSADERMALTMKLVIQANEAGLSAEDKDRLARRLAERLDVDYDRILEQRLIHLMTPDEVTLLPAAGVDVQLHTHRHRTPGDHQLFVREILDNRAEIETMTRTAGAAVDFCYPSGVYDPQFLPWLRELGVRSATTCEPGIATRDAEPLLLPRVVDTSNIASVEFEAWLAGVGAWLPRRAGNRAPASRLR